MPAASQEAGASPRQERVDRAVALLREALQIIDSVCELPEMGAKLNDILESLEGELNQQ